MPAGEYPGTSDDAGRSAPAEKIADLSMRTRVALLLVIALVVIALCALVPVPSATTWGTLSVVCVAGGFRLSSRHAVLAPVAAAIVVVIGLLASTTIGTAVAMVACYGAATVVSQRWRLLPIAAAIGSLMSLATVSPPPHLSGRECLFIGLSVLIPGLLVAIAARLLFGSGGGATIDPTSWRGIGWSLLVAVPPLAGLTWLMVGQLPGPSAWWALLTFFVVLVPTAGLSFRKIGDRVVGTLIGGLATAIMTLVLPYPWLMTLLCLVTLTFTIVMNMTGRYLLYSLFLTMTIMFAAHETASSTLMLDALRVGATVLGALVAALTVWLISNLTGPASRSS